MSQRSPTPDGRVLRGARNRERILEALIELVREGSLRPTAEQVAERAGVGTRTVFRHFDDMEGLLAEMNARIEAIAAPIFQAPVPEGPVEKRATELVDRRAALYEEVGAFMRAGAVHRWRSPYLSAQHATMIKESRRDVLAHLPELRDAPSWTADAVETLVSFEAWNRLRQDQRMGRERTASALREAVLSILRSALP